MYKHNLLTAANRETIPGRLPPVPFESPLTIIDTSNLWPFESQNAFRSRFNMLHALLARNLVRHFQQSGVLGGNNDVGICTPYSAQARLIQKLLEGDGLDHFVHAGTVHRFQGDERRIVLLEIPESHGGYWALGQFVQGVPPKHVGARLLNVAVSRAQEHLVVLANLTYLDKRLPSLSLLRGILYEMQQRGRVVPGEELLELRPIESDLAGLVGHVAFDEIAENIGIFDEKQFERGLAHDIQAAKESSCDRRTPATGRSKSGRKTSSGFWARWLPRTTSNPVRRKDRKPMTAFTMDSLEETGSAAREFWEDDLQTALEPLLASARRNDAMDEWIGKRTGRQVSVLCANLGTDGTVSVREKKNVLRSTSHDDLVPYLLVDQFAKFKSKVATIDFAKGVLTEDTLKTCHIENDEFDKTALLFAIYHRRPEDLRVVFHLDKIHKSGFARMNSGRRLGAAQSPSKISFGPTPSKGRSPTSTRLRGMGAQASSRRW